MSSRGKQKRLERGKRVYLRTPTSADAKEFIAIIRAAAVSTGRGSIQAILKPRLMVTSAGRGKDYAGLLICGSSDDRIVGMANLSHIFRGNLQSAYLGFWASAEGAGQGHMTEGIKLVLRYAFKRLRLHRIEANVQPDNAKSKALIKRSAFRYEGLSPRYVKIGGKWPDHERWAILAEEWRGERGTVGATRCKIRSEPLGG